MDIIDFSLIRNQLKRIPKDIIKRLQRWAMYVESTGLTETRKIPGFRDELLKGKWKGHRSARLGHKWRVIYKHNKNGKINIIKIKKVVPHEY